MKRIAMSWQAILSGTMIGALGLLLFCNAASALNLPDPMEQEILVKSTLMTFNDANETDNYSVLLASSAKPFRDQFTAEKLTAIFKPFRDKNVDIKMVVGMAMKPTGAPEINNDGVLRLRGYFETKPKHVVYDLKFIQSDGVWKPIGIHVATE
ncbi:MAG TPA: hypothetical protein VMF53_02815 [Alphaproteobacteria bacterium]|nr:hypothetical protein [Alphaproteobacteria bacterium]